MFLFIVYQTQSPICSFTAVLVINELESIFVKIDRGIEHAIVLFSRTLCNVVSVMTLACVDCLENSWYLLLSNKLSTVVDLLAHHLSVNRFELLCLQHKNRQLDGSVGSMLSNFANWPGKILYDCHPLHITFVEPLSSIAIRFM